jgi:hypothetical protein
MILDEKAKHWLHYLTGATPFMTADITITNVDYVSIAVGFVCWFVHG